MRGTKHQKFNEILIVDLSPYFLKKDALWFEKNLNRIKESSKKQNWWRKRTLWLSQNMQINLLTLLRRLTEMGYKKVQTLGAPGEFAHRGGIVDIFPINEAHAWRLELTGNKISFLKRIEIKILRSSLKIKKELNNQQINSFIKNLKIGDFLVHSDHGIGRFAGFATSPGGQIITSYYNSLNSLEEKKFFVLNYAKGDRLYIPLTKQEKISPYFGFEKPIIHRLGGNLWFKTKKRAKEATLKLARDLLTLYAKRTNDRGWRYLPDDELAKELANGFPYTETTDQAKAITEIKKDMESLKPVDRLICGDVGFGKTEVALRAAFKAVFSNKQVALLCPTTILANQHWQTFSQRLEKFPVRLSLLTRLQTKKQQEKILKEIKNGQIDILIGTHRILSPDVIFKNLGLAIIDEEQRFGVKQKEVFKNWRANIDILSLSATPIPRTLYLALSKLKDISIIATPPPGRLPIKTFIEKYNEEIIKKAIYQEIKRKGQIFFLHNRIETIGIVVQKLRRLIPQAKIGIIHGRLPEKQLLKIVDSFANKKIDILVSTTIIENGLDFPNANTLIVDDAIRLGLAQAYQLRGRIGRSYEQAFAYFLYEEKKITEEAKMRLYALKEAEAPGSGYQIALKDLEIRGAGNILGKEQSGPINAVGLNLYLQMLNESVEEIKNQK